MKNKKSGFLDAKKKNQIKYKGYLSEETVYVSPIIDACIQGVEAPLFYDDSFKLPMLPLVAEHSKKLLKKFHPFANCTWFYRMYPNHVQYFFVVKRQKTFSLTFSFTMESYSFKEKDFIELYKTFVRT